MGDARPDHAKIAAQVFTLGAQERQRLIEPTIAFYESVNELRDDQKLHLVTLYEYHQTLDALAAAEQRATESAAFVRECAEAMIAGSNKIIVLVDALDIFGDGDDPLVQAALYKQEVVQGRLLTLGLRARDTAPATQPDERAAAERAVIAAALSYYQKEYDGTVPACGMREAFQALWRTIKALGDLATTDGAAKETT